MGHPKYQGLSFEATAEAEAVVMFLDIRGFTSLSLELDNEELARILQKLTRASVRAIKQFGGYVGEFTGDGVMAYFDSLDGPFAALQTASFLMAGVREVVNPALKRDGDTGVKVAVGMEYGTVLWTRIGVGTLSTVKPISEVTFVAGKLSTRGFANPWECRVGEQLAVAVPDEFKKRVSGYPYKAQGIPATYGVFAFDWEKFVRAEMGGLEPLRRSVLAKRLSPRVRLVEGVGSAAVVSHPAGPPDPPRPPRSRQVG
jgi:class 3 adenylate cyclase